MTGSVLPFGEVMSNGVTDRPRVKSKVGSTRRTLGMVRRFGSNPECNSTMALLALQHGKPLGRELTLLERIALAVASTKPTHFLTLQTVSASQKELAKDFRLLLRRIERRKSRPDVPLIYVGGFAQGHGAAGYHLHLLLWGYQHMPMYHGQTNDLGLGNAHVVQITPTDPQNVLRVVSYALGQQESVFGTNQHTRHQPRERSQRRFNHPQRKTLAKHNRELFVALDLAKNQAVSDQTLFAELPTFIREGIGGFGKGDLESELAQTTN